MKRSSTIVIAIIGLFVFPQYAWANAGTPLMWAGMLHLSIGNALVGLFEGYLVAQLFGIPRGKAIAVMIIANYISAWLGGLFIRGAIVAWLPLDLDNGWRWLWLMVVVTYCMTLIIEWPFIAWCFRGVKDWLRRSLRASLVAQSASYVLLFGWYWMASGTSLYTKMNIVAPDDIALPKSVLVYFISPTDGNVYSRQLVGGGSQKIYDLRSTGRNDRLFTRPSATGVDCWDLVARIDTKDERNPRIVDILANMTVDAAPDIRGAPAGTWFNFGQVQRLGAVENDQWEFFTGFWPIEGLESSNKASNEHVRFSYETPFGAWAVRNAVHLPSDKVLFQLGDDQICIFDPATRRVTLLWHGRGPAPVIEKAQNP